MFTSNQNEIMNNFNVILNKNYNVLLSRLEVPLTSMNLKEYIDNIIDQLEKRN